MSYSRDDLTAAYCIRKQEHGQPIDRRLLDTHVLEGADTDESDLPEATLNECTLPAGQDSAVIPLDPPSTRVEQLEIENRWLRAMLSALEERMPPFTQTEEIEGDKREVG